MTKQPDFPRVVREIGLNNAEIADRLGCSASTISRIRSGRVTDPFYSLGAALLALHETRTKRQPRRRGRAA